MPYRHYRVALSSTLLLLTQCTSSHVIMDHMQLRDALMDYTEEQIVDNVVRARSSMPIMHFDMDHVDAVVKTSLSASGGGGRTKVSTSDTSRSGEVFRRTDLDRSLSRSTSGSDFSSSTVSMGSILATTVGLATSVASTVTQPLSWGASAGRDNTIDVQMTPVTDENAVYTAYERFVSLQGGDTVRDSRHFAVPKSDNPDDPDGVHVGKRWRGVYYWVPNKYKKEFFKLCVEVSTKRDSRSALRSSEAEALKRTATEIRRLRLF
jgi:hypothetical protein